jgi:hypothetical protein
MFRNIDVQFEPIDSWPGNKTVRRRRGLFKSTVDSTYRLLDRELTHLGARRLVIQADCDRRMIRQDGLLRSDARLNGPGIIVSFDSRHGPVRLPCDTFQHWDDNLRAIALALEALRAVDRYGVTRRGEQYQGWTALPAPDASGPRTVEDAQRLCHRFIGGRATFLDREDTERTLRECEMATHPDRGGNAADFKLVQRARAILLGS